MSPNRAPDTIVAEPSAWVTLLSLDRLVEIVAWRRVIFVATREILIEFAGGQRADPRSTEIVQRLTRGRLLDLGTLSDSELGMYFSLTSTGLDERLSDGEAAAIALAAHRRLPLLIQDKKVGRLFDAQFSREQQFTPSYVLESPAVAQGLGNVEFATSERRLLAAANPFAK